MAPQIQNKAKTQQTEIHNYLDLLPVCFLDLSLAIAPNQVERYAGNILTSILQDSNLRRDNNSKSSPTTRLIQLRQMQLATSVGLNDILTLIKWSICQS